MDTKKIKLPYGIPGHNLKEIEREVPVDEPNAWPVNDELKVVGKRIPRQDALAKVTGKARFTADIQLAGMLQAAMLRADNPHAIVNSINTAKAESYPGVYAVHVFKTDDGKYPEVKFAGQAIAGVAAQTIQAAKDAVSLIEVDYTYLPFVVDIEDARKPGAPLVFTQNVDQEETEGGGGSEKGLKNQGNVRGPSTQSFYGGPRGDVEAAFASADVIAEGTYQTQVQTHVPLETHGVVVNWRSSDVTIYSSTQNTRSVRNEFAAHFDLPKSRVRVIAEFIGGGFGAKHSLGNFGVMAGYLSKKSGRPVKLMLNRKEEHISAGNRPNSIQFMKIAATKDGKLTSIQQRSHGTAGVGLGAGVGRIAQIMYECPNFSTEQYDVFTNAGPGAAWRAPGNVQGAYALEQVMDELAEKLDMDPLKLRDLNDKSEVRRLERQRGAKQFDWSRRKKPGSSPGPIKKGLGVAQSHWPRFVDLNTTVEVRAFKDGAVEVRSGVQDIGTGTKTVLAQVVAEELGLQAEDIEVRIGDTIFPDAAGSGGSIVTGAITPPARNAAYKVKNQIFEQVAKKLEVDTTDLVAEDGMIKSKSDTSKSMSFKDGLRSMRTEQTIGIASRSDDYGGFFLGTIAHGELGSVQFAEVTVDTETGFVKVDKIVAAHSCGRPLNITQVESQINGGIIQGVSYALYEDRIMDKQLGHQVNANIDQYKMPFSFEIPEIESIIIEDYSGRSSTDAYGIGEPANIATAVAVANAVYNAIGVRIKEIPITPDRVLKALGKI